MATSCRVDAPSAFSESARAARLRDPRGVYEGCHTAGGRVVALRVAGRELGQALGRAFLPARAHARPELTIDLWDESATGVRHPGLPGSGERLDFVADGRYVRCAGPGFEIWCDRAT